MLILTGGPELMAFEFRCPYGLVFDEKKLVCEWPWLVPACSESGSGYTRTEYNYGGFTAGASPSDGIGHIAVGIPEYSVTTGTDSNVDYSRTTSGYNTDIHGNYFGSTGSIGKHPGISTSDAGTVSGHVGLSSPAGTDYSKSTEYREAVSSIPTYSGSSGIQIGSVPPSIGEGGTRYSASNNKIEGTGYTVSSGQGGTGYSVSTGGFSTGFANTGSLGGITAGFSGSSSKIGGIGYTASTSQDGTRHSVSTGQDGTGHSISTGGFNTGFANTGSLGEVTGRGFSGSTSGEYSGVTSGSHLTEQGVTYTGSPISSYPSLVAGGYRGGISTSNSIIDTSHSRIPGTSYFGSTGLSGSTIDVHIGSTSPKYVESKNVYAGSSTPNADGYSASTGIYTGVTGRQPSFGETGPLFGSVSYSGATGNIEITGSTNKEYTGSTATAYEGLSDGHSKATGGISAGSTESNIHLSTSSGIGSNLQSATDSSRIPGTNLISGVPKSGLGTSGISTFSGHVSVTPGPTGASSTGYKYNSEEGYTIPVLIQHEEPSYLSFGTTGTGVRSHAETIATSGISLTGGYGKTDFARPNLNISIFGNEIPTNYDVQKGITGTIQTGGSIDGSIITGDSFSGTVFSHGNVPGGLSTPAINQGTLLTGEIRPGYVTTSSGTPGYTISDGVKTIDKGSASPGTVLYGTPSPAFSTSSPSTAGIISKSDSTPGVVVSGQTGVFIGDFIQPGSTVESSTPKSYISQPTYHGISGAPAKGSITYSSSTPSEGLIPTLSHGYRTDEGHGTATFNAAYDISKYTENDIPDYRPTSSILPDSIVSGGRIKGTGSSILGSTFGSSTTVAPEYSLSKSTVFTPSGFTKTGPTRTGITTAILGGGGSYSISTSDRRPTYNPDNISEKAFEGNIAGYSKTSSIDGLSVTLTPPGYSSTAAQGSRITVQSATSGYSYPKPNVQFETSGAAFSSTPIAPIGSTPFFARLPTSTITPIIYTTEHPEIYKTTLFESKKIPTGVSTARPIIDTGYKTVISPTTIPVPAVTDDQFIQQTGSFKIPSVSTSGLELGVPFQRADSSGPTGYSSSLGYLPAKSSISTETDVISSTTQYDIPTVTARPELGITYKKPSPDVTYGGPSSFQSPTTFRPSNVYYSGQGFSTTPSSLGITPSGGSPTNLDISRDKIDKLITNYDRGTVKYTPSVYDTYASSEFGSTSSKKFTSSLSSTKSSFSAKTGSGLAITMPFGIRPTTFSYEVTTKSPEGKGKVIVKWSDLHPLLLGKLGAECTCKADPFANLRGPGKKLIESSKGKVDLANYDDSEIYVDLGASSEEEDYSNYDNFPPQPYKISPPETTTVSTNLPPSSYLPATDTRTSGRSNELRSSRRMGKKLKDEEEEEEEKEDYYDDDPDQIINGVTDCARPGLFRHPGLCNKFYACHWDQWKKKFTLHIFNCPIHLTFDSNAGACNWPSKGPACQADNLLV